ELAAGFAATRETLLDERSSPLGFGADPNVLYYASNVGRATFGIYALDLRSGARTEFSVEDPNLDLARPQGDFPAAGSGRFEQMMRSVNVAAQDADATMAPPV